MAQELIPGGKALGIKMLTDGVMVAGVQSVETKNGKCSPAEDAGIRKGDLITRIGAKSISSAEDLAEAVQGLDGEKNLRVGRPCGQGPSVQRNSGAGNGRCLEARPYAV